MSDVTYWCELAWLHPGEAVEGVVVRVEGRRFAEVVPGDEEVIALTVPEIRRLFALLVFTPPRPIEEVLRWSYWRRRH